MTDLARIPVVWDGLPGLPGVSVFYSTTADANATVVALNTFFGAIKASFPPGLTWQVPSTGDTISDGTGTLTGSWSGASGSTINATGTAGNWAGGVGARVKWGTSAIINKRRVRGSTFLVPLLASQYDTNGTLGNGTLAAWQTAANTLVAAGTLRVWHRPAPGGTDGLGVLVTSAVIPDKVSTLRTRRT